MKRNPLVLVVVAIVVAGMLFFGMKRAHRDGSNASSGATTTTETPAAKTYHDFTLQSLDGKTVHLADFKGKGILLNFWATDCVPCQIETPWLVELQKQYGAQGLQILGVDTYDGGSRKDVEAFTKKMAINYPILVGKDSEIDTVANSYGGIAFLPQTFVISRDSKVVGRILGLESKSKIEDEIKLALAAGIEIHPQVAQK